MQGKFHSKLMSYFQILLWKSNGWWGDEKEALTPLSLLPRSHGWTPTTWLNIPPCWPLCNSPSLLFFSYVFSFPPLHPPALLSVRLTNSDTQEAKRNPFRKTALEAGLSEIRSGCDLAKRCIQWRWMTLDVLALILEMFCNPTGFNHRFRPWTPHLFRVKTFTSPPPPPPSLFLQAVIQRAAASRHHSDTLQEKDLHFINNPIFS